MAVIETHGLTRRFGDVVAVNGIDLLVEEGTVFGFLGHNGAGKTTTIRLLNGVLAPSGGTASVLGMSPLEQGAQLRCRTGVLTESSSVEERLTGRENLTFYADLYNVPVHEVAQRVDELLSMFELQDRADDKAGGYSKGMHQRLALARALVHKPEILFLDEPTSSLDPVAARQVHNMIHQMARQERRTVFLCTHNLPEAQRLCDQVAVLEHGKLVALGTPHELAEKYGGRSKLEIEVSSENMALAVATLQALPVAKGATAEGNVISIPGADRESIPPIVAALAAADVHIYRVAPTEATLEDVYFALHDMEEA